MSAAGKCLVRDSTERATALAIANLTEFGALPESLAYE